jgi:hypothetical protein
MLEGMRVECPRRSALGEEFIGCACAGALMGSVQRGNALTAIHAPVLDTGWLLSPDCAGMASPRQAQPGAAKPPFEATYAAFQALVSVESYSRLFVQELDGLQRMFEDIPPHTLSYVAPAEAGSPEELRKLIDERRAKMPPNEKIYWTALDRYHSLQRAWRKTIEDAKLAADGAAWELDSPGTPPLQRTTVSMKRTLQRMGGSVPPPMYIGDGPPIGDGWIPMMRKQREEVSNWVDELRLLLVPRSPDLRFGNPPIDGVTGTRPVSQVTADTPSMTELAILGALLELGAVSADTRKSAEVISLHKYGKGGSPNYVRDVCTQMKSRGWLGSKAARGGGFWLLERGIAVRRLHSPTLMEEKQGD